MGTTIRCIQSKKWVVFNLYGEHSRQAINTRPTPNQCLYLRFLAGAASFDFSPFPAAATGAASLTTFLSSAVGASVFLGDYKSMLGNADSQMKKESYLGNGLGGASNE